MSRSLAPCFVDELTTTPCSIKKGDTILMVIAGQTLTDFQNSFTG